MGVDREEEEEEEEEVVVVVGLMGEEGEEEVVDFMEYNVGDLLPCLLCLLWLYCLLCWVLEPLSFALLPTDNSSCCFVAASIFFNRTMSSFCFFSVARYTSTFLSCSLAWTW